MSIGQPATTAQYFADLRLVCSLINGAWPHSQNLITGPGTAESLGQHIASTSGDAPRRHTLCDAPPLDARPGAALITAAARILDGSDLLVLGERAACGHLDQAEGGGAAEQPGVAADAAEVLVVPVVLQVLGDVPGSESELGGGCPASA